MGITKYKLDTKIKYSFEYLESGEFVFTVDNKLLEAFGEEWCDEQARLEYLKIAERRNLKIKTSY